jgi:hypothetical protein
MDTIFLICAAIGGTLLLCQLLLTVMGWGGHHDFGHGDHGLGHHETGHDAESSWFASLLTFRTIVAALTFFGLAGLTATSSKVESPQALLIAAAAGAGALFLVAWLMRALRNLRSDGTVHVERAVGHSGTVYLTVPGRKAGAGKVTLTLQNRTMEYQAITANQELPTGAKVVVVSVVSPDTVEVIPANDVESATHA